MARIKSVRALQVLDSRGNPTVEAVVELDGGFSGRAIVPSGASTGAGEALELRDGDLTKYGGKGVLKAVANVNEKIASALIGQDAADQKNIDQIMLDLDGTEDKVNLGANAILAVSLATAKAEAAAQNMPLYEYIAKISDTNEISLPMPMMNIMNGGEHGDWVTDIQEYMIMPISAGTIADALRMGSEVFQNLKKVLKSHDYAVGVGDEGGFAPRLKNGNEEPFQLISEAIKEAGYELGKDFVFLNDVAATEFFDGKVYNLKSDNIAKTSGEMIEWYRKLRDKYQIVSIEDGMAEDDWAGWNELTAEMGDQTQLVGDDLLVTNVKLLQRAIDEKSCNSILVKVNQIGSLSETIAAVKLAHANGFTSVMSHRSGETEDTTIAHLAVGLNCGQIKTGSLSRSDRVAKYNELLRIADENPSIKLANPFARQH